jgi:hypothetical protein
MGVQRTLPDERGRGGLGNPETLQDGIEAAQTRPSKQNEYIILFY